MKLMKWSSLIAAGLLAFNAWALTLEQAKDSLVVGETPEGYLAVVKSDAAAEQLVAEINAKRKAKYLSLAKKNGISLSQVEALAGAKAIEKTQSGHMVKVNGQWQRQK